MVKSVYRPHMVNRPYRPSNSNPLGVCQQTDGQTYDNSSLHKFSVSLQLLSWDKCLCILLQVWEGRGWGKMFSPKLVPTQIATYYKLYMAGDKKRPQQQLLHPNIYHTLCLMKFFSSSFQGMWIKFKEYSRTVQTLSSGTTSLAVSRHSNKN